MKRGPIPHNLIPPELPEEIPRKVFEQKMKEARYYEVALIKQEVKTEGVRKRMREVEGERDKKNARCIVAETRVEELKEINAQRQATIAQLKTIIDQQDWRIWQLEHPLPPEVEPELNDGVVLNKNPLGGNVETNVKDDEDEDPEKEDGADLEDPIEPPHPEFSERDMNAKAYNLEF